MHRGYIKLYRKILEWEWWEDPNTFRIFIYLLLTTNHSTKRWRGIEVKKGEVVTSTATIKRQTRLSTRQIRTSLNKLKSTNEVTIKTTNKYSIIKLNNFNLYHESDKQDDKQATSKRQANDKQATTTKNNKELKNDKKLSPMERVITPAQKMKNFLISHKKKDNRYVSLLEVLSGKGITKEVAAGELDKFVLYWTELNKSGTKERWQLEKTFEVNRRLATWFSRAGQFQKQTVKDINKYII